MPITQPAPISDRVIVPVVSDMHGGHINGLMNPETVLELEDQLGNPYLYQPEMTEVQKYLWNILTDAVEKITALAAGSPVVHLNTGDLVMGNKYLSELVRPEISAQVRIAFDNFIPLCRMPNTMALRLTRGTGAHEFGLGAATSMILQLLRIAYPAIDIQSVQHGWATIGGLDIDYSHHGPGVGRRVWLEGNEVRYYLRDCMLRDIVSCGKPADVYIRGHVHAPVIETMRVAGHWATLIVMPSMMMGTEHTWQVTRSVPRISNGIVALEIQNGKLIEIHEYIQTQDLRTKEVIDVGS